MKEYPNVLLAAPPPANDRAINNARIARLDDGTVTARKYNKFPTTAKMKEMAYGILYLFPDLSTQTPYTRNMIKDVETAEAED